MNEDSGFQIACICGSMRFKSTMMDIARQLTSNGYIVLMPFVDMRRDMGTYRVDTAPMLAMMHLAKIRMSDIVYVVDCEVPGKEIYIGYETQKEIEYATVTKKPIAYYSKGLFPICR